MEIDNLLQSLSEVSFIAPSIGVLLSLLCAIVLLFLSGLASGSEIAFFSLSPKEISQLDADRKSVV